MRSSRFPVLVGRDKKVEKWHDLNLHATRKIDKKFSCKQVGMSTASSFAAFLAGFEKDRKIGIFSRGSQNPHSVA